jgi:hypothetical protein
MFINRNRIKPWEDIEEEREGMKNAMITLQL